MQLICFGRDLTAMVRRMAYARLHVWMLITLALWPSVSSAVVLPEERADVLFHYYDGGGVTVSGPAILARKSVSDTVSMSARYYVDMISSASIDVVTTASPYRDKRTEYGVSLDYLHDKSLMSFSYTTSKENDYLSDTYGINLSHDLFGGLTTATFGYSHGQDTVMRVDTSFQDVVDRHQFRAGLNQIVTRRLMVGVSYEGVTENGFLNNPYRSVRIGLSFPGGARSEVYPRARDSQAIAFRGILGLGNDQRPLVRSLRAEYRYFQDTWDISAHTLIFGVQRYFGDRWSGEFRYRYYQQSAASFYADLFPTEFLYMARDKELSTFHSHSFGIKSNWQFLKRPQFRSSLGLSLDYMKFEYDDFSDPLTGELYSFNAIVGQLFLSFWY